MSTYRPKGSPFYQFDFQLGGVRFSGSTRRTNERDARAVEKAEREKARQTQAAARAASTSLRLRHVAGRYWQEVGQHHAGKANTWRDLDRLVEYFGPETLLTEIGDDQVARLVAWRRGHRVQRTRRKPAKDAPPPPTIGNATVNRSTTEVLKKLFTRARTWGVRFEREPNWKLHRLAEPQERVRELVGDEAERLEEATRDDYGPFFAFARASGLRLAECLLKWSEVDWGARRIRKPGKGGKLVTVPITGAIREILWPLQGHHPEHVFTYVATSTRPGRIRGQRYPVTYQGAKTAWRRLRRTAGVEGFRFHDFRHDVGTKLLRQTGNLKLVQRALNHADLKTTAKYAHVLDSEVAAAFDALHQEQRPSRNRDAESPEKSRSRLKKPA
jgi:integrase